MAFLLQTASAMNFYRSAALALDHLDKHQGSVKGSLAAAKVNGSAGESKRILAREWLDCAPTRRTDH